MGLIRWLQQHGKVRAALAAAVVVAGLGVAVLTLMVGHCSAFGGRCPAEPVSLWDNDVFGGVGIAVAVSAFALAVAIRPDRRGVTVGAVAAVVAGPIAGLWAAVAASG